MTVHRLFKRFCNAHYLWSTWGYDCSQARRFNDTHGARERHYFSEMIKSKLCATSDWVY